MAEEKNKRTLEKIRRQQMEARQKLVDLDQRHQELDAVVEKARHARIVPEQEQVCLHLIAALFYCVWEFLNPKYFLKHVFNLTIF